ITGLKMEDKQLDYLEFLHLGWSSNLIKIALDSMKLLFKNMNGNEASFDYALYNWDQYMSSFIEYSSAFNYKVFPTGLLKRLHSEVLKMDYDFIAEYGLSEHPIHGDIYSYLIESYYSHHFFDVFLGRMLGLGAEDLA